MNKILGVIYLKSERISFVSCNLDNICIGSYVIVSSSSGLKFGKVYRIIDEKYDDSILDGSVVREATDKDINENKKNIEDQDKAFNKCKKLVDKLSLNMKLIGTEFMFDRSLLLIYFYSEERVDFRELAKQMASFFKTRIEFRQIGIRDKSKLVGGIGPCGRKLCCSTFLYDFDSISISMAKNQAIALNPSKINGVCGRLLCCLKYEDETYREFRKNIPSVGKKITVDGKNAKVVSIDLYNQKYIVEFEDKTQKEIVVEDNGTDK